MNTRILTVCSLLLSVCSLFAQEQWTIYNVSNSSISGDGVIGVEIDASNHIWIATNTSHSLDQFDGSTWNNKVNNQIQEPHQANLVIDLDGHFWIGGEGLNEFNDTAWTNYDIVNSGLPENFIYSLAVDQDNNKWIGTNTQGLVKFDGQDWTIYDADNTPMGFSKIYSLAVNPSGDLWIGTHNDGVWKFDGTNWLHFDTSNSEIPSDAVFAVGIDPQGNLWCGTLNGVGVFNGSQWTIYNEANSDLPDDYIGCFAFSPSGTTWIGTRGGGLARITGTTWKVFNTSNSELPDDKVWDIAIENDENKVWVATNGGGIALLNLATAISDPTTIAEIQILPNPSSQLIYLKSATEIDGLISVAIYDAAGRMIKSMKEMNADSPIDISALPIGHYSARIESAAGISIGKFVVE